MKHETIIKARKADDGDYWLGREYFGYYWKDYKHEQVTQITVVEYHDYKTSTYCWIAEYFTDGKCVSFDETYDTLEDFWKWNDCFSKDIIFVEVTA